MPIWWFIWIVASSWVHLRQKWECLRRFTWILGLVIRKSSILWAQNAYFSFSVRMQMKTSHDSIFGDLECTLADFACSGHDLGSALARFGWHTDSILGDVGCTFADLLQFGIHLGGAWGHHNRSLADIVGLGLMRTSCSLGCPFRDLTGVWNLLACTCGKVGNTYTVLLGFELLKYFQQVGWLSSKKQVDPDHWFPPVFPPSRLIELQKHWLAQIMDFLKYFQQGCWLSFQKQADPDQWFPRVFPASRLIEF